MSILPPAFSRLLWRNLQLAAAVTTTRSLLSASVLCAVIFVVGCSRTVLGGYTDSPDKKYRVYGRVYGAYGRSFVDNTPKTIRISIVAAIGGEKLLLRKEYRIQGADVGWDATWDEQDNLTLAIFEYPPSISRWDLTKKGAPTNHILGVIYHFDSKTVTFTEATN